MKTNKFQKNSMKAVASFFVAGLIVLTVWCFKNASNHPEEFFAYEAECNTAIAHKANSTSYDATMQQLLEINAKIAKLEQEKNSMNKKLEKAKAERNKNYGIVAGMYSHPSPEVAEISNYEGGIAKLGHKIDDLKKKEMHIAEKYGIDVQQLALMK